MNKYKWETRIRFSEVDETGNLPMTGILNYFQDTSTFQSEDLGVGVERLRRGNRAWVLSSWQIEVKRYPKLKESITCQTWATGFRGFMGFRNFLMTDEAGEALACAHTIWSHINAVTGHPIRPPKEELELYGMSDPYPMEEIGRKIPLPKEMTKLDAVPVHKFQIDTNGHVNNCQYVAMMMDLVPQTASYQKMRVEYKQAAVYGDVIYPCYGNLDGKIVVALCNIDGDPYAVAEFRN